MSFCIIDLVQTEKELSSSSIKERRTLLQSKSRIFMSVLRGYIRL